MKKIISAIMAMALISALATSVSATEIDQNDSTPTDANTSLTLSVEPTYTVTIPSTIELQKKTTNDVVTYEGSGDISTDTVRLTYGEKIKVTMASDFELTSDENATLDYTVKAGTTPITLTGATVAEFNTSETAQSVTLSYAANDPEYAGDYSDIVTFTLSVVEE